MITNPTTISQKLKHIQLFVSDSIFLKRVQKINNSLKSHSTPHSSCILRGKKCTYDAPTQQDRPCCFLEFIASSDPIRKQGAANWANSWPKPKSWGKLTKTLQIPRRAHHFSRRITPVPSESQHRTRHNPGYFCDLSKVRLTMLQLTLGLTSFLLRWLAAQLHWT